MWSRAAPPSAPRCRPWCAARPCPCRCRPRPSWRPAITAVEDSLRAWRGSSSADSFFLPSHAATVRTDLSQTAFHRFLFQFLSEQAMSIQYSKDHEWINADRKSTRLNSSHQIISYAVFCLKKKKNGNIVFTKTIHARPTHDCCNNSG